MASNLEAILAGKYPAKDHARKVAAYLKQKGLKDDGVIYLEGQKTKFIEDNDSEQPFRQRRFFFYLSGCLLPDALLTYHISSDELTLYIPPLDPDSVIWSGLPMSPAQAKDTYDVDKVLLTSEINPSLAQLGSQVGQNGVVFSIQGQISDSTDFVPFPNTDFLAVKTAIEECRAIKDAYEIALLRKANDVTAQAHVAVYKAAKSAKNERELEAAFIATCIAHGCRELAYHPIVASGTSGATLHYVNNNDSLIDPTTNKRKLNLLLDAAGEYRAYCADVTRTFPLSGKFSPESREIYDIVLEMQLETLKMIKEGVLWEDVHIAAHRIAIKGLLKLGILKGTEEELFDKRISVAFFPHGLGHYLGMDTHDTGGHANYEDKDKMFRYLRVRGNLPAGSVVTVEPGIYFCRFIIEPYLQSPESSKYIDNDVLEKYWEVGGIRIEDNIHVTKDGHDNLTSAPKYADEIELWINGS
ncbi:putative Xaa-Pro aminopeptidase pepP [Talaromyces proteolyticus]|uniref:Probable Xaa-Pro aminopeptidase PEPP n=1 Tax=Talaromyces proteolyticus TaxID=1131652 RepID=A0AAD4KS49_9EURO|nr:putative Xaa-Pro aminopeptidase pepP [Talaromyces proteolyticus]KAH8695910.1 putative Xaa-Pro aminopeptidase pepP [Talaromyces proteolyticus]